MRMSPISLYSALIGHSRFNQAGNDYTITDHPTGAVPAGTFKDSLRIPNAGRLRMTTDDSSPL